MIKAIIFDCFGVLISDALKALIKETRAKDPKKAERIIQIVTDASRGLSESEIARSMVAQELNVTDQEYVSLLKKGEIKNHQLLNYIKKELRGRYKIGVLSNVFRDGLQDRFSQNEMEMYFDAVVISGNIGYSKPQAAAYKLTADRLGVRPSQCIMIDDIEDYCRGAETVGMQAILYRSFEQMKAELEQYL